MAYISVTYTFVNGAGQYIDANQCNQNWTDIVNGLKGGTYDLNMGTITAQSMVTGDANFGGSTKTITFESFSTFNNYSDTNVFLGSLQVDGGLAASGSEFIKIYTINHKVTAGEASGHAITEASGTTASKIRSISCVYYNPGGTSFATTDAASLYYTLGYVDNVGTLHVSLGTGILADTYVSVTIVQAA